MNLRRPIVTNGDFESLCESAYNDRAVVWRGEWGGPGIHVLDESPRASREGAVSGMVSGIFRNLGCVDLNGEMAYNVYATYAKDFS